MAGLFPFGRPNAARPVRQAVTRCEAFVLGVYPSALHVKWMPPAWAVKDLGVGRRGIAALAVDVEPTVFWDGIEPSGAALIGGWLSAIDFRPGDEPGCWGDIADPGRQSGTSGRSVIDAVLAPLGVEPRRVAFSDVVNTFYVKRSGGRGRRQQGDAVDQDYGPFAAAVGLPPCSLPARPPADELVALAVAEHGGRIESEIAQASAPLLITLGEESRSVIERIASSTSGPPAERLDAAADDYGGVGDATIAGSDLAWRALVHPGQRSARWDAARRRWTGGLQD